MTPTMQALVHDSAGEQGSVPLLIGVAVLVWAGRKLLMLERKGSHGAGTWAIPGGHVEPGEWPWEAAERELFEEVGLVVGAAGMQDLVPCGFDTSEFRFPDKPAKRYVTLLFTCAITPKHLELITNKEPEKIARLEWVRLPIEENAPGELFLPLQGLIRSGWAGGVDVLLDACLRAQFQRGWSSFS